MATPPSRLAPFGLTLRQRRRRLAMLAIVLVIVGMLVLASWHPLFHIVRPPHPTEIQRKALALKAILLWGYATLILLLAMAAALLAWFDMRDQMQKALIARRDMWKEIVEESRQRRRSSRDQ